MFLARVTGAGWCASNQHHFTRRNVLHFFRNRQPSIALATSRVEASSQQYYISTPELSQKKLLHRAFYLESTSSQISNLSCCLLLRLWYRNQLPLYAFCTSTQVRNEPVSKSKASDNHPVLTLVSKSKYGTPTSLTIATNLNTSPKTIVVSSGIIYRSIKSKLHVSVNLCGNFSCSSIFCGSVSDTKMRFQH